MGEEETTGLNPLDENFFYNSMLAKALVQLIPPNERTILRVWFDKLLELGKTNKDKELRNEYMWFILLMLQCQKVREPFNALPPSEIEPLRDLVPSKIYEEILVANDDNMSWLENPESGPVIEAFKGGKVEGEMADEIIKKFSSIISENICNLVHDSSDNSMSNPIKALNEHFYYNTRLAKALQQLLVPNERKMIQTWFDKLIDMDKTTEQMVIRSDYMWFILLMLQSKKIREPFSKLPPPQLVPLKKFVPLHVYEDVLILNEPNMVYIDRKKKKITLRDDSANTNSFPNLDHTL